jgi:tetratricopeptide (TPR) repeat protein
MAMNRVVMIILLIGLGSAPLAGQAQEELFDTKAAAQHLEQGLARLGEKHYDSAIAEFQESAEIAPEAEAFYYLGYAYYLKGRKGDSEARDLSRENFEKAYEIDPNFSPTRLKQPEQGAGVTPATEQPAPPSPASTPAATNAPAPAVP